MKKTFTILIVVFLFSCTTNQQDKLIGNWYLKNDKYGFVEFNFYKDSLIVYDSKLGIRKSQWKADKSKIYLKDIDYGFAKENELTYLYEIDKTEKLNLKILRDSIIELPALTKANSVYDFFQMDLKLSIDLPISKLELKRISFPDRLNFNIYAGYRNNGLIVKTDLSSNLENIEEEVNNFKFNSRDELKPHLKFHLIADKKISKYQIDSIKSLLRKTPIKKIFRVYKTKKLDYENNLNWFGKLE